MTQEELDALMKIGEELESDDEADDKGVGEAKSGENADFKDNGEMKNSTNADFKADSAAKNGADALNLATNSAADSADEPEISTWSPPPPSKEHKVVHQLDEVTRDSEEKAIEMMDRLENIGKFFNQIEIALENIKANVEKNKETFTALNAKFPHIQTFQTALDASNKSLEESEGIFKLLQQGQDEVFTSMDAMQYQDIHRQKIERAINVMRALNRYMNSLFDSSIDDSKRVSSAVYIAGDGKNDVVDNDDIENLIASLRQNK